MHHLSVILRTGTLAVLTALQLSACQTPAASFNPHQLSTLEKNGFKHTEDGWALSFTDKLLFDLDAAVLTEASRAAVGKISSALLLVGIDHLRIEGHTDISGSDAYNDKLSLARANAVADALSLTGTPRNNIIVAGVGKNKPVASNTTASGRAENRRVTIIVSVP